MVIEIFEAMSQWVSFSQSLYSFISLHFYLWLVPMHWHQYLNLLSFLKDCVRQRATKSLRSNPYCSEYMTKLAMEAVWDTCYNDTKPSDKTPWNQGLVVLEHHHFLLPNLEGDNNFSTAFQFSSFDVKTLVTFCFPLKKILLSQDLIATFFI